MSTNAINSETQLLVSESNSVELNGSVRSMGVLLTLLSFQNQRMSMPRPSFMGLLVKRT